MNGIILLDKAASAAGAAKMMAFLLVILLAAWCMNAVKHIRNGWTTSQKICDIIGAAVLVAAIAAMILPLMK